MSTAPRLFGIIGDPIGHTLSPVIHTLFSSKTGQSIEGYVPFQVSRERLPEAIRGAHALGIAGMNVTVPHKSAVIPELHSIDPLAEKIGAVNTLVYEDGGYRGYNTDATGLGMALRKEGVALAGARVVILGAGGAARAAAFLCADGGAAEVLIINRSVDRAEALAQEVCERTGRPVTRAVRLASFLADTEGEDRYLAIQCTSVGLMPDTEHAAVEDPEFFKKLFFAVDIVYRPLETKFLRLAKEAGVPTMGGLSMLLYQAADAFALWFPGSRPDDAALDCVMRVLRGELRGYYGINLIGYMGSGKTTVGRELADALHFDLWDTDRMIEESTGRSVSRIFAEDGEALFRQLETKTLEQINAAETGPREDGAEGLVLSTGGGLPLREENRTLLREGFGRTVYLRVRPETVIRRLEGDETRPLLAGADAAEKLARVEAMLTERGPVYESCADLIIDTDDKEPGEIAAEILKGLADLREKEERA